MERFWSKVNKTDNCWIWTGCLNEHGYGQFRFNGKTSKAHRVSYILSFGKIDNNLVIDHLCKNTKCVNPEHLELVTQGENVRRGLSGKVNNPQSVKTHCYRGHEFSGIRKDGARICRECNTIRQIKYRNKKRSLTTG
jgi:hypothetical protein